MVDTLPQAKYELEEQREQDISIFIKRLEDKSQKPGMGH